MLALGSALYSGLGGGRTMSFSLADVGFSTSYSYKDSETYSVGDVTLPGDGLDTLSIHWLAGDVSVHYHDKNEIIITESAKRELEEHQQLRYRLKGGRLDIQYCESRRVTQLFNNMPSKTLHVYLPTGTTLSLLDLELVSSGASINAGGRTIREVDLETVSGSARFFGIDTRTMDVETVSGSVEINGTADTLNMESVSGSITMRLHGTPREIDVETVSGSIRLYLSKNTGFTANLETVSGSIKTDFATQPTKRTATNGDGKAQYQFETISGSVNLLYDAALDTPMEAPTETSTKPTPTPAPQPTNSDPIPSSKRDF